MSDNSRCIDQCLLCIVDAWRNRKGLMARCQLKDTGLFLCTGRFHEGPAQEANLELGAIIENPTKRP